MSCGSIDIEDISNTIPKTEYQNKHAVPNEDAMKVLIKLKENIRFHHQRLILEMFLINIFQNSLFHIILNDG